MTRTPRMSLCTLTWLAAAVAGCEQLPSSRVQGPVSAEDSISSVQIDPASWSRLGYSLEWRSQPYVTEDGGVRDIIVSDDLIVALDKSNMVSVIEAGSGRRRGVEHVASPLIEHHGLVRLGNTVWVCGESEALGVDLTSVLMTGRQPYEHIVGTPPLSLSGFLVFGASTGEVRTHSLLDGVARWSNAVQGSVEYAPIAVEQGGTVTAIGVVSDSGEALFIDPYDGRAISRSKMFDAAGATPESGSGLLFVASRDQSLYAFAPGQQRPYWRVRCDAPLSHKPVHMDGVVYCDLPGLGFSAIDARSGSVQRSNREVGGEVVGARGGNLLVWDGRTLSLVDKARLDVVEKAELPGVAHVISPAEDRLYLVGDKGLVVRLRQRS